MDLRKYDVIIKTFLFVTLTFTSMVFVWVNPAAAPPPSGGSCAIAPPGLVSWWGFEGNANDLRGNNTGVVTGPPSQFVPGEVGLGFQSGGLGSLVVAPNAPDLFAPRFTIDVWTKVNSLTTSNLPIVWRGNSTGGDDSSGYGLGVFGSPGSFSFTPGAIIAGTPGIGKIFFIINNGTLDQALVSSLPIPFGSGAPFTHIAASIDGFSMRLYVNGVLDANASQIIRPANHGFPFQIGSAISAPIPGFYFSGVIDELDYFDRALSSTEVQSIFNAGAAGKCGGGVPPYVGRVCIAPGETPACPQTLQPIIADSTGHATVSVNILGSTIFNSYSIFLRWDSTVMNGSDITAPGTVPLAPTVTARCINNSGLGCGPRDGLGIAHVDVYGAIPQSTPVSGHLFNLSFVGGPGARLPIGFASGCGPTQLSLQGFSLGTVPNTDACVTVGIASTLGGLIAPVSEGLQSQSLGVALPTPLAPSGLITDTHSGTGPPSFADTWVLPDPVTMWGNITSWKAQFVPGILSPTLPYPSVPTGVQVKVLRRLPNATNILQVVGAGPVHEPGHVLRLRLPSYPYVKTEWMVIPYYTDSLLTVQPGDYVGLTIMSNATLGGWYNYPFVNATSGTRVIGHNVPLGGTIDLTAASLLPNFAPAIEVTIQPTPPTLDTSSDGIPDFIALSPEGRALGMDPCRKTVAVQLDYMTPPLSAGYSHRPLQAALDLVTQAFDAAPVATVSTCPYAGYPKKPSGINLILDVGNSIPQQDVLNFTHSEPWSFDSLKATYLDPNRAHYFHYGIFANTMIAGGTISGAAEIFGSNFIVSLGGWTTNVGTVLEQAGTLMHELGHNLGLDHGGSDSINFKPNYESVMSYEHQVVGIVTRTPTGDVTRLDYSREAMPTLNETSLSGWTKLSNTNDYTEWVCPGHLTERIDVVSNYLDWNCDGILRSGIVNDVNNDTKLEMLKGYNDWANLRYKFVQSTNFNIGCYANCDVGCYANCDIGCYANCDLGVELDFPTAKVIEATWSAFLASPHRPTATTVNCAPSSVSVTTPSSCTATVSDIGGGSALIPSGIVSFNGAQPGSFSPALCTLSGTGATAKCTVSFTPGAGSLGPQTITVGYTGDTNHLGSSGSTTVTGLSGIDVLKFYTDGEFNALPTDTTGIWRVDILLARGVVKSTNPGEIIAWVLVTNSLSSPLQSLKLNETLPLDWVVASPWLAGNGGIHVYYVNTSNLNSNLDITQANGISATTANPEIVHVAIPNFSATAMGHPLMPGESILLQVNLDYGLKMTGQVAGSYPRNYTDTAIATAWSQPSYAGSSAGGSGSASFIAKAKVAGDVDDDGNVNIFDLVLVAHAFGSKIGDPNYNAAADLNNDGKIDIFDLAIVGQYFGS